MMRLDKKNTIMFINILEKLHFSLATVNKNNVNKLVNIATTLSKVVIQLEQLFKGNQYFQILLNSSYELLELAVNYHKNNIAIENKKNKILDDIKKFEFYLLSKFPIKVFISTQSILKDKIQTSIDLVQFTSYKSLENEVRNHITSEAITIFIKSENEIGDCGVFDIVINEIEVINTFNHSSININNIDYYLYDRLFLEAKLESLKMRQEIELILAGSSYTMCGLFEKQMLVPSRNVAVDAQDLYYSILSINKAIEYNPNIKYCVLSFAYYFWGYDLSRSTSEYQLRRVTDVNYPVFLDKHNFPYDISKFEISNFEQLDPINKINPLLRKIFNYEKLINSIIYDFKTVLADSHYFRYPRTKNIISEFSEERNIINAQERANSHNKFFKYEETVKENKILFEEFLKNIQDKGILLLIYVPPVSSYYRKFINKDLIKNYYELMNPFKENYNFILLDFFDDVRFTDNDFYDYDHLNDFGAKKFGEIIVSELKNFIE